MSANKYVFAMMLPLDTLHVELDDLYTYSDHALRIVRPGGVIVVDNALAFGSLLDEAEQGESVRAVRAFNDRIAAEERLQSVLVPLGDGMWIAHVLAE